MYYGFLHKLLHRIDAMELTIRSHYLGSIFRVSYRVIAPVGMCASILHTLRRAVGFVGLARFPLLYYTVAKKISNNVG